MSQAQTAEPFAGTIADNYERYFVPAIAAPVAEDLIAVAALAPGERVLDVACGTGIVARMALDRVGPSGSVAGLDGNPGMLATAREQPGAGTINWYESSMESMPLPDAAFDVVFCQIGLQFVTGRQAAVAEMYRILRPGGRMFVTVPGPAPAPFTILADALARHIGEKAAMFAQVVFSLNDEAELRTLAGQAGFGTVSASAATRHLLVPAPADFLWQYIQSTPLADVIGAAGESRVRALSEEVADRWQEFATEDGRQMRLDVRMSTLSAHKG